MGLESLRMQVTAMAENVFKPGEKAPQSGIYKVLHYQHRLYHEVTVLAGQSLPSCRRCGKDVRFQLVSSAVPVEDDADFQAPGGGSKQS
jgi:hypothetical protein